MGSDRKGVAFKTLGCKVNRVESEQIATALLGAGISMVDEDDAAVVIVNSCTVTGEADAKVRKTVRHALGLAGAPAVVVTGCLANLDPESLRALDPRVVVEQDKTAVASKVAAILGWTESLSRPAPRTGEGFRTRSIVKIEDGCDSFCSYCIIPYARGVPRSVPAAEILAECRALLTAGVKEFVLTGVNLGRYRAGDVDLAGLVREIGSTGVARLRLSSIEPMDLQGALLEAFAETPSVCAHLHVPLQSGCDKTLAAMNRQYTVGQFEERIAAARDAIPGLSVTTDVIAGFPGESDADAEETLATCARIGFSKMHVFRYSARKGTPAAEMTPVQPAEIARRAEALRSLGDDMRRAFLEEHVGRISDVLVEKRIGEWAYGKTGDYADVRFTGEDVLVGDLLGVRFASLDGATLVGHAD